MRAARAEDWRRRIITKEHLWKTRIQRFSIEAVPGLGTIEFPFPAPLTVFSGPNGAGKSTLLRALWAALDPDAASDAVQSDRKLASGNASVNVSTDQGAQAAEVQFHPDGAKALSRITVPVYYIDAASDSSAYKAGFNQFDSVDELTNGVAGRELKQADLAEVSFLLSRDYRSIKIYEVELGREVPFFEVAYGDDRYDSRTMGAGEIAALHIWWSFERLKDSDIVLIEEPEAFLSFSCQNALMQSLSKAIVKKKLCAVISTHSAPIIAWAPPQCVQFLSRGQGGLKIAGDKPHPSLLRSLGIDPPIIAALFVEDHAAKAFCSALLERNNPTLARQIKIEVRGGESEISAALRVTSTIAIPMKFFGVYDGDFKQKVPSELARLSTYLPGEVSIEKTFRDMVTSDPECLIQATGSNGIPVLLDTLEGVDNHDWFETISKEIGFSKEQVFPTLFLIWLRSAITRLRRGWLTSACLI